MANYGMKVSKSGFDVKTTGDKNLVFSSEFNTFKRRTFGNTNLTISSGASTSTSITHNVGSRPAFLVYYKDNNNHYLIDQAHFDFTSGRKSTNIYLGAKTDTTKLYFDGYNNTGSQETITIYYEIFYETI